MNENTNHLQNFKIYRDTELSRWETYKPQLKHTVSSFGNRLWINIKEFGNLLDAEITKNSLSNVL